ncbi:MAG: DUF1844 domain-containing protein [Acidobacteria bacterium]|nr:DUF1844 domain-containing protein [Acidobacteriota bacterium]
MSDNPTPDLQNDEQDASFPIPPPTMEFLVLSLKAQAEMQLGFLHFGPEKDRPKPDFRVARHTIDLLSLLQDKTRGNLTMDEQRLLENSLTELRFRFVQAMESAPTLKAEGQAQG